MNMSQRQIYSKLVEYLGCAPDESLLEGAFRVVRSPDLQSRRLAAHAVIDIGAAQGPEAWAAIRRAIRLYESCRDSQ